MANLAGDEAGIPERVAQQCCSLDTGDQVDRELARVAPAHLTELVLGPVQE